MAILALHTAATGMNAISTKIDVVANNLANANTTGFKAQRVNFEDLLYQEKAQPGVENANGDQRPAGIFVGLGTRVANTDFNFQQGSPINTGQPLDLLIDGNGFFAVDIAQNESTGTGYTRAGNFFVNSERQIVLGNSNGPRLEPPIELPPDTVSVDITADGQVLASISGEPEPTNAGEIPVSVFVNPKGLRPLGDNIFVETEASGPPLTMTPGTEGAGTLLQGFLEASNVDPVEQLVDLIKAQRAFEMNSQSIDAADRSLQVISNLGQ